MKHLKSIIALLLCFIMVVAFAACGKKDDGTTEPDGSNQTTEAAVIKTGAPKDFSLSIHKILKANEAQKLLEKYDVITVEAEKSNAGKYTEQVFKYDGDFARVKQNTSAGGISTVEGYIKGFDFTVENGCVKAQRDVEKLSTAPVYKDKGIITSLFDGIKLRTVEETQDYYKIKCVIKEDEEGERYVFVNKADLSLMKITYETPTGYTEKTTVTFNGELEAFTKEITHSFEGEMKKINVKGELYDGESITKLDVELELPADWEYLPSGEDRIDYYMNESLSDAYEYPGHGKDYTIYITNIFSDEDAGKK